MPDIPPSFILLSATKYLVVFKPGFIGFEKLGVKLVGTLNTKNLTFEILVPSFWVLKNLVPNLVVS